MQVQAVIKALLSKGNVNVFLGICLVVSSVFMAYSSNTSLRTAQQLDTFSHQVQALQEFTDESEQIHKDNERRITILETQYVSLNEKLSEVGVDIKTLLFRTK